MGVVAAAPGPLAASVDVGVEASAAGEPVADCGDAGPVAAGVAVGVELAPAGEAAVGSGDPTPVAAAVEAADHNGSPGIETDHSHY